MADGYAIVSTEYGFVQVVIVTDYYRRIYGVGENIGEQIVGDVDI